MELHAYDSSIQESREVESWVWGQPKLHRKLRTASYTQLCLKIKSPNPQETGKSHQHTRKFPARLQLCFLLLLYFLCLQPQPRRTRELYYAQAPGKTVQVLQLQVRDTEEGMHLNNRHEKHLPDAELGCKYHLSCHRGLEGRTPLSESRDSADIKMSC